MPQRATITASTRTRAELQEENRLPASTAPAHVTASTRGLTRAHPPGRGLTPHGTTCPERKVTAAESGKNRERCAQGRHTFLSPNRLCPTIRTPSHAKFQTGCSIITDLHRDAHRPAAPSSISPSKYSTNQFFLSPSL